MTRCTLKFENQCFRQSLTSSNWLVEPKYAEDGRDQKVCWLVHTHLINPESVAVWPNQIETGIQGWLWPSAGTYLHQWPNGQKGVGEGEKGGVLCPGILGTWDDIRHNGNDKRGAAWHLHPVLQSLDHRVRTEAEGAVSKACVGCLQQSKQRSSLLPSPAQQKGARQGPGDSGNRGTGRGSEEWHHGWRKNRSHSVLSTGDILPWGLQGHWLRSCDSRRGGWDSTKGININTASSAPRVSEALGIPVTTPITFSPTAVPPDEPSSHLPIFPSQEVFIAPLFAHCYVCPCCPSRCPSLRHLVPVCFNQGFPGDSFSFSLTSGFNISSPHSPAHPRSHPWGVATHSVKFQEGTVPRLGCCFLWPGFLIPMVCRSSEIHNNPDLGWVLLFSVLFREAQQVRLLRKGALKYISPWDQSPADLMPAKIHIFLFLSGDRPAPPPGLHQPVS